jgi:hypothetical protein
VSGSSGGNAGASSTAGTGGSSTAGTSSSAGTGGVAGSGVAGADATTDPGTTGARDPNGPCKDLELFCFDPFDMFIFNPECFTCNSGMGCVACELFQAI